MSITLVFVIVTVITSIYGWNNESVTRKWIFNPYTVKHRREYHRFLTSGFLHSGIIHLLFNMFVLYMFGEQVEHLFRRTYGDIGAVLYSLLYLVGIVVSDIPTFLKYRDAPHYNALGASGGVSSILFSYILFDPASKLYLYGLLGLPGVVWAALYLVYSYYMSKRNADNINHDAHLYGGLFGIVFTILAIPGVIPHFFSQLKDLSIF